MGSVTVKDIAQMAGVSVATVSRVINQNGRFSPETERRVREVIEKCHYQPNQLAKGLRQHRTASVGIMVPNIANEFFSSMILAMQTELFEHDYAAVIYNTNASLELERQCQALLAAQSVAGVIAVNSLDDVRGALKRPVPTVYVDRFVDDDGGGKVACISSDNERSGRLAARELIESGCHRLALIEARADSPITRLRTQGFVDELAEAGLELDSALVRSSAVTSFERGRELMDEVIDSGREFDGVFCQADWLAMGALEALREHGIEVPRQVCVVGHDDISIARFGRPPVTTIRQEPQVLGQKAAELVVGMICGEAPTELCTTVPVELVRRESTRAGNRDALASPNPPSSLF